jgi:hypothetical protein
MPAQSNENKQATRTCNVAVMCSRFVPSGAKLEEVRYLGGTGG